MLVVDFAQPDSIEEKLDHPMATFLYSTSIATCLSSSLSEEGGAGIGAFGLNESLLKEMAEEAGFTRFRHTDVVDRMNAYYELRPQQHELSWEVAERGVGTTIIRVCLLPGPRRPQRRRGR